MASPGELTKAVAHVLGIDPATVANTYRGLREAGLVRKGGRGRSATAVAPEDCAALLIAIGATNSVTNAAEAASLYSQLRASFARRQKWTAKNERRSALEEAMNADSQPIWKLDEIGFADLKNLPVRHSAADAIAGFLKVFSTTRDVEDGEPPAPITLSTFNVDVVFSWPVPVIEIGLFAEEKETGRFYSESLHYYDDVRFASINISRMDEERRQSLRAEYHENKKDTFTQIVDGDLEVKRKFGITTLTRIGKLIREA